MRHRTLRATSRSGITLLEILISILILGVGMISLATLFPLGLLRLREAQRSVRSSFLIDSAEADVESHNLLDKNSFLNPNFSPWYSLSAYTPYPYNPWIQDTPTFGGDPRMGGATADPTSPSALANPGSTFIGQGLPVAYDPLWRYVTQVYPNTAGKPEARFASGIGYIRNDTGGPPSAHGLQRVTNYIPTLINNAAVQEIFVSPEDSILQQANQPSQDINGNVLTTPSTVVPLLTVSNGTYVPTNDWRFTWLFTGRMSDVTSGTCFVGDIVVLENRPFAADQVTTPVATPSTPWYVAAGEPVVEGVFGWSGALTASPGYGRGSDRVVLLRWPNTMPDPEVSVGSWIADVTYERSQPVSVSRFGPRDFPGQRCYWYQVVKKSSVDDESNGAGLKDRANASGTSYRAMTVWVATPLKAKTLLNSGNPALPVHPNAALVSPYVVNVVPRTFYTR